MKLINFLILFLGLLALLTLYWLSEGPESGGSGGSEHLKQGNRAQSLWNALSQQPIGDRSAGAPAVGAAGREIGRRSGNLFFDLKLPTVLGSWLQANPAGADAGNAEEGSGLPFQSTTDCVMTVAVGSGAPNQQGALLLSSLALAGFRGRVMFLADNSTLGHSYPSFVRHLDLDIVWLYPPVPEKWRGSGEPPLFLRASWLVDVLSRVQCRHVAVFRWGQVIVQRDPFPVLRAQLAAAAAQDRSPAALKAAAAGGPEVRAAAPGVAPASLVLFASHPDITVNSEPVKRTRDSMQNCYGAGMAVKVANEHVLSDAVIMGTSDAVSAVMQGLASEHRRLADQGCARDDILLLALKVRGQLPGNLVASRRADSALLLDAGPFCGPVCPRQVPAQPLRRLRGNRPLVLPRAGDDNGPPVCLLVHWELRREELGEQFFELFRP